MTEQTQGVATLTMPSYKETNEGASYGKTFEGEDTEDFPGRETRAMFYDARKGINHGPTLGKIIKNIAVAGTIGVMGLATVGGTIKLAYEGFQNRQEIAREISRFRELLPGYETQKLAPSYSPLSPLEETSYTTEHQKGITPGGEMVVPLGLPPYISRK